MTYAILFRTPEKFQTGFIRLGTGMYSLSRKATVKVLENDARLTLVGIFTNSLLYVFICATSPGLAASDFVWATHFSMAFFVISRSLNVKVVKRLLRSPNGIQKQRAWYTADTWLLAVIWGSLTFYSLKTWGFSSPSSIQLVLISGCLSAFVSASITFDLVPSLGYQIIACSLLIAGITLTNYWAALAGVFMALAYGFATSLGLHKTMIRTIQQAELVKKQYAQLRKNTELIAAMHESLDESFILLNSDGAVTSQVSNVARKFFPNISPGAQLSHLLGKEGPDAQKISQWFEVLYSDRLNFEEMAKRGPQFLQLNDGPLALRLKFQPLRSEDGHLRSVIFTATNVSAETKAQQHLEEERERAALILRIFHNKEAFVHFLSDFEKIVKQMVSCADLLERPEQIARDTKRELHNLKGAALLFGLNRVAQHVYAAELAITTASQNTAAEIRKEGNALQAYFSKWRDGEMNLFIKLGVFEGDNIEVPKAKLQAIERDLQRVAASIPNSQLLEHFEMIRERLISFEFGDLLSGFEYLVATVGQRLGKKISFTLVRPSDPILIDPNDYRQTVRTFVHVFNNCIDHGIETPEQRLAKGKQVNGQITVRYDKKIGPSGPIIRIEIEDDGRGIDVSRVREKIKAAGKNNCDGMTDLEVAAHVLTGEFSTRDSVSEISGHGVGMGAVRSAIKKAGGTIQILRTSSSGTIFEITLPFTRSKGEKQNARG